MRKRLRYLGLLVPLLLLGIEGVPDPWDATFEAAPANTDAVGQGDDEIRDLRKEVRPRLNIETHFGTANTGFDSGLMRIGSARCFIQNAAPTTLLPATIVEYNNNNTGTTSGTLTVNSRNSAAAEQIGDGRCWVDLDGLDGVAGNSDDNTFMVHDGVAWLNAKAVPTDFGQFLAGTANLLNNGSFEDAADATAILPAYWTELDALQTYAHTDNPAAQGAGHFIRITTDNDANNDGITQSLAGLKANTSYYLVARVTPTDADYCQLDTTGATTNVSALSTAASVQTLSGTFTTTAVPAAVLVRLVGIEANALGGQSCDWDYVGVFERNLDRVPTTGNLVQFSTDSIAADTALTALFTTGSNPSNTLTVTVPGPGYNILVDATSCLSAGVSSTVQYEITEQIDAGAETALYQTSFNADAGGSKIGSAAITAARLGTNVAPGSTYIYRTRARASGGSGVWENSSGCTYASNLRVQLLK